MICMNTETADIKAIEQVVATVERAQRAKDVEGFLTLFHPDALWTTGHGKVLIGFDAIAEFTRTVLPAANWEERSPTRQCTRNSCGPTWRPSRFGRSTTHRRAKRKALRSTS
ncbi:hypothetical protein GCM10010207_26550 [Streptomyces atratus]|nr:hypothetical protein GCM10010207_26550 [Streptomyces atratus]